MRRREFITLLGCSAAAWPLAARAQRSDRTWKIGMIMAFPESDPQAQPRVNAFLAALKELGWSDRDNIKMEYRWAAGEENRIRAAAADLVAQAPDVVVANGSEVTSAVKSYTRTIPIVFVQVSDPVGLGVVESLAHPGGNVTGLTHFEYSVSEKWLQLLKEVAPSVTRITVLLNSANPAANGHYRAIEAVATPLGVQTTLADVKNAAEIEHAISSLTNEPNGGLIILPDNVTLIHRERIVAAAARHGLPAMYPYRYFVTAGGLVCYGVNVVDLFRGLQLMLIGFSREQSRLTSQSRDRSNSIGSSISRPQRHSAWRYRRLCSPAPTRPSNEWRSPLLAQSRHGQVHRTCPLSGGKADITIVGRNVR